MSDAVYPHTGRFMQGRLRHALTRQETDILEALVDRTETIEGEKMLLQRGEFCSFSTMLIEGFMLRTIRENGKRCIVGFQVPGDFVDLHAFALKRLDHDLLVIGRAKVGYVPHDNMNRVLQDHPHLMRIFWSSTVLDAAIHREWIMKTAVLRATGRVAHLIAEIWYRLRMVDMGNRHGFQIPMTQAHLATICGISPVHMSRTVRDLREAGIADFKRGRITILDEERLKKVGEFDPAYLYGEGGLAIGTALNIDSSETRTA